MQHKGPDSGRRQPHQYEQNPTDVGAAGESAPRKPRGENHVEGIDPHEELRAVVPGRDVAQEEGEGKDG